MIFSSLLFLFRFMPAAFLLYYLTPNKLKNLTLLILSLFFYAWGEPKYIWIMAVSILVDYSCSQGIKRLGHRKGFKSLFLGISVAANLGMLLFFKYSGFFIDNINALLGTAIPHTGFTLPLGISFYTFQTMSYTIDVYRGKVEAEDNLITFGAFVVLFPQLIAGPIVKYSDISKELKSRTIRLPQIEDGVRLFIMGLGSKVLLANNIGALWTEVEGLGSFGISSVAAWLGAIAFSFQIYFDFSGYSLMAIGLGKMLGFNFPQNFNYPYIAKSITDFWRRWHMTLSSWFREYIYIPLGGNRVKPLRMYLNLFIVWFCTGFWHGASWNFILWGLHFFLWLMLEKYLLQGFLRRLPGWLRHGYTLLVVFAGWGVFAMEDLSLCGQYFKTCFGGGVLWNAADGYYLSSYGLTLVILAVGSTHLVKTGWNRLPQRARDILAPVLMLAGLVICTAYLVDGSYNPFLYFRF